VIASETFLLGEAFQETLLGEAFQETGCLGGRSSRRRRGPTALPVRGPSLGPSFMSLTISLIQLAAARAL
jgi:hypothetical protein